MMLFKNSANTSLFPMNNLVFGVKQYLKSYSFLIINVFGPFHWVLPWSRYKKKMFDFLVTDFVLLL